MAKKENKANKENKHFWRDFKAEIKKVIWPTPKQLINSTVAIITMVIVVAVIVFVLDLAFDAFNKYALTNLQEVVQTTTSDENSDSSDAEATDEEENIEATDNAVDEEATIDENSETEEPESTENAESDEAEVQE